MVLTQHQQRAVERGLALLDMSKRLLIRGSAGVGKTTSAQELIRILLNKRKIIVAAPTHKALAVLREKVADHHLIEFKTVQSTLKLKRKVNKKDGTITFRPDYNIKYPPLQGVDTIIIDEASMISKQLLELIEKFATEANCKVVFLGDDKQINPVGEEDSPVFQAGYPEVELSEIIRQGLGNPIIDLSRNLSLIDGKQSKLVGDAHERGYAFSNDREKVIASLAKANGTDEIKYLARTNKEVDSINRDVRKAIYNNPKKVEIGETLVFNAPYRDTHYTNGEIKVNEIVEKTVTLKYLTQHTRAVTNVAEVTFKVYCINPQDSLKKVDGSLPPGVIVIHEDSERDYNNIVAFMKQQAKAYQIQWIDYYHFQERFADLKYNHAITVHKAQGSTYQKTIINVRDIRKNRKVKEKTRLFYTGVTRASELLILYNI